MKPTGIVFVLTTVFTFCAAGAFADAWYIETVDTAGIVGEDTSIALDDSNYPHISYFDNTNDDLKYAYYDGSDWQIESVDTAGYVGQNTSVVLDDSNNPHISYFNNTNDDLKYAYYDGFDWQIESVDTAEIVGEDTSIALDDSNYPHISYFDNTNDDLKYAYYDGSDWQIESVDTAGTVGLFTSIALDASDNPHISYWDTTNYDLKYAHYNGSDWQIESVDTTGNVGTYTSIALDALGYPHISYFDYTNRDLKYAYYDGSSWHFESVDTTGYVGYYSSIALDASDNPHISYFNSTNDDLKYAYYDGSDWQIESVDTAENVGSFTSIALDASDNPHISYHNETNYDLKYAWYNTPPAAFDLLSPADGATVTDAPTLDWEDAEDCQPVTYDLWYSEETDFDPHVEVTDLTDSTYTFAEGVLNDGTTYYWKVRAWDGYEETWSGPSNYWSFTMNAPPGDFNLTAPPDGSLVTEPVVLDWEDSIDPGRTLIVDAGSSRTPADTGLTKFTRSITYDVWYATAPSFDPHDEITGLTDSTYTFPEGSFNYGTTYYWKVRAWDGYEGTWSGPGPYWSFTVEEEVADIPVTSFSAESVRDGVEVSWECAELGVGFNLYRSEEAVDLRSKRGETLNAGLITGESPYRYLDTGVSDGVIYNYWLEALNVGGATETFGPVECIWRGVLPSTYALYQSRPNPARANATIAFDLPEDAKVTLAVYDISGRKVTTLVDEMLTAGTHERIVSGLVPGMYLYKLTAGDYTEVRKIAVIE